MRCSRSRCSSFTAYTADTIVNNATVNVVALLVHELY
jgi:hypothetical protein